MDLLFSILFGACKHFTVDDRAFIEVLAAQGYKPRTLVKAYTFAWWRPKPASASEIDLIRMD